jgi:hypothetical protein
LLIGIGGIATTALLCWGVDFVAPVDEPPHTEVILLIFDGAGINLG